MIPRRESGQDFPKGYEPDGVSALEVLKSKAAPAREKPLFWKMAGAWPIRKDKPDHRVSWAVVEGKWKLVAKKDMSYVELYDIAGDVGEKEDLSGEKPEVVAALRGTIEEWNGTLPEAPSGKGHRIGLHCGIEN